MGLGAFPGAHRQSVGMLGMHGTYEANKTMHHADVIFAVGVRRRSHQANLAKYCPDATVLHRYRIRLRSPKRWTPIFRSSACRAGVGSRCWSCWCRTRKRGITTRCATGGSPSSSGVPATLSGLRQAQRHHQPQAVIETLHRLVKATPMSPRTWASADVRRYYPFDKPRRWINSGGLLRHMGFRFAGGIELKLALPEETPWCA